MDAEGTAACPKANVAEAASNVASKRNLCVRATLSSPHCASPKVTTKVSAPIPQRPTIALDEEESAWGSTLAFPGRRPERPGERAARILPAGTCRNLPGAKGEKADATIAARCAMILAKRVGDFGGIQMKRTAIASLIMMSLPTLAFAQSAQDLRNAANTPDKVLIYGMSYSQQRFSPLTQINKQTVGRLVPAWAYSLDDSNKEESQAMVMDGVIYITAHDKTVAIDVKTGKEIWKTMVSYPPETPMTVCCGIENRGGALYNGKFFRTILDGRVQALDIKTGKEVWNTRSSSVTEGYAMT